MAGNPLISQGTLNRLKASITWNSYPALNVTPSFLNREGIRLALDGEATRFLPTLGGVVTSPEPYVPITLTINLLKTQGLAGAYLAQMQNTTLLGDCVVRPDVAQVMQGSGATGQVLPPFDLTNVAIQNVRELAFAGEDAGVAIICRGYFVVNTSLWN